MINIEFTQAEFELMQSLAKEDIEDLCEAPQEYFDGCFDEKYPLKDYVDLRIALCEKTKVDFWETARRYSEYSADRLKAMYGGMTYRKFIETYEG